MGPSRRPKLLAPRAHGFGRFFFSRELAEPDLRVLLPLLPAAERGGVRRVREEAWQRAARSWAGCFGYCRKSAAGFGAAEAAARRRRCRPKTSPSTTAAAAARRPSRSRLRLWWLHAERARGRQVQRRPGCAQQEWQREKALQQQWRLGCAQQERQRGFALQQRRPGCAQQKWQRGFAQWPRRPRCEPRKQGARALARAVAGCRPRRRTKTSRSLASRKGAWWRRRSSRKEH